MLAEHLNRIQRSLLSRYHELRRHLILYYDRFIRYLKTIIPALFKLTILTSPIWISALGSGVAGYILGGILAGFITAVVVGLAGFSWAVLDSADTESDGAAEVRLSRRDVAFTLALDGFLVVAFVLVIGLAQVISDSLVNKRINEIAIAEKQKFPEASTINVTPDNVGVGNVANKNSQASLPMNNNVAIAKSENTNTTAVPSFHSTPPELESPSSLWSFLINSYDIHREENRLAQIGKAVTWNLVLMSQGKEEGLLKLTLHEDETDFESNASIPLVTCHIPISSIDPSIYKELKSLSHKYKNFIKIAGRITRIPSAEGDHTNKPTIEVDKKVEILEIMTPERSGE
jgi:hypothetical protein